jgi:hypothetical protein
MPCVSHHVGINDDFRPKPNNASAKDLSHPDAAIPEHHLINDLGLLPKSKSKSGGMLKQEVSIEAGIYKAKKILGIRPGRTNGQTGRPR